MCCVFDLPEEHMETVRELCEHEEWLEVCKELPPLQVRSEWDSSSPSCQCWKDERNCEHIGGGI